jgi:hypothetical protein
VGRAGTAAAGFDCLSFESPLLLSSHLLPRPSPIPSQPSSNPTPCTAPQRYTHPPTQPHPTRPPQGFAVNPCNSKLHPSFTEAGIEPDSEEELSVQEAYTPESNCWGCGARCKPHALPAALPACLHAALHILLRAA